MPISLTRPDELRNEAATEQSCQLIEDITHADLSLQSQQEDGAALYGGSEKVAGVKVPVVASTISARSNTVSHSCVESVANVALEHRGAEAVGETPMRLAEGLELSVDEGSATYGISSHHTLSH